MAQELLFPNNKMHFGVSAEEQGWRRKIYVPKSVEPTASSAMAYALSICEVSGDHPPEAAFVQVGTHGYLVAVNLDIRRRRAS